MRFNHFKCFLILGLSIFALDSRAQSHAEKGSFAAGLRLGWGMPSGDNLGAGLGYGAVAYYHFDERYKLGVFADYQMASVDLPAGQSGSYSQLHFGLMPMMYVMDRVGPYVGLNLGMTTTRATVESSKDSSTDFHYGAQAGYEYAVDFHMIAGFEIRWLFVAAEGETTNTPSFGLTYRYIF
jgi:hypothetical protein